ncbi:class II glutamine amidotransferase [Legionella oakridgensis]|uniref:Glutamine amidotransferase n=2 Tax=Legionella oakridgensis TaxID=29423 RepID=A0A0W0X0D2_9GAMM|nr:class II glutamine amidotransferase [Legionella oakridgensis]AHE67147.1 putative glutamine amidotransferase [Legionella oakridgensis ATCC 33761 = DSM 21215]ETO93118.1 putative glutamine amidotransferase [Legionella oakridgensis RV-2-2007]KTD38046.1 glutamine amidotransferase [Legionella oakridgensis]STY20232.1 putative glutamine amidotransferase [Legionella longbeachae]
MCRILSYLGRPVMVEELLYKPDNSFIKQSYHPKYMSYLLNLAGFGMAAWEHTSRNPLKPYLYKTPQLPFYDENLRHLASKITPHCLLAHLRGVSYHESQVVANQNVHPFVFPDSNIALAHNGSLHNFNTMRYDLLEYIHDDYRKLIKGTTDSEWIYAVFLSQLSNPLGTYEIDDIVNAIISTLKILKYVRHQHDIAINSPVNLFITNGEFIVATRFVLDYGWLPDNAPPSSHFSYHSLWYTYGESYGYYDNEYKMKSGKNKSSIIIASEPLTEDTTTWLEVPEYTLILAYLQQEEIKIISHDISL